MYRSSYCHVDFANIRIISWTLIANVVLFAIAHVGITITLSRILCWRHLISAQDFTGADKFYVSRR